MSHRGVRIGSMKELIHQTRSALAAGLYYLALLGALALPDICGALASDNGKASGSKYKGWLRDNVPEQASNADLIWGLRCSLWHQGSAASHKGSMPIAFMFPSPQVPQLHNLSTVGQRTAGRLVQHPSVRGGGDARSGAVALGLRGHENGVPEPRRLRPSKAGGSTSARSGRPRDRVTQASPRRSAQVDRWAQARTHVDQDGST